MIYLTIGRNRYTIHRRAPLHLIRAYHGAIVASIVDAMRTDEKGRI